MTSLKKSLPFSVTLTLLLSALLLAGCSSSGMTQNHSRSKTTKWSSDDPACKVNGMYYVCMRPCQDNEIGPSHAACITKTTDSGDYCDCGTRMNAAKP